MSTVDEIENAVASLPPRDLAAFRAWFEAFDSERFDAAIEHDAGQEKLDRLAEQALSDHRAGRSREL